MKRVLLDVSQSLTRVALVEGGQLVELYYETERSLSLVGNVYAARVEDVVPNLQACFVEIGQGRKGYFYYGAARALSDEGKNRPKGGDTMILQVEKDAVGTKGAVLTKKLSFPGKFLVLLPTEAGEIGISRKITDEKERVRIRAIIEEILPQGMSLVVRTNGEGKEDAAYREELRWLLQKYETVQRGAFAKAPALLIEENKPMEKAVRDFYSGDVDEFVINDKDGYEALLESGDFNGLGQPRLIHYEKKLPLFEEFFVESQSGKALDQRVWLKSGGFLVIEETEACVVVDVNSGKAAGKGDLQKAFLKTNLEAAEEVAKQLRLRNLSGIIIVDFIDMASREDREGVTKALERAVKKDRIKTVVVGMTELGLMQITRKKTRPSLSRQMTTKCRTCEGSGRLPSVDWTVVKMRREVESVLANTIYSKVTLRGDKRLLAAFCGERDSYLQETRDRLGGQIFCEEKKELGFSQYEIEKEK